MRFEADILHNDSPNAHLEGDCLIENVVLRSEAGRVAARLRLRTLPPNGVLIIVANRVFTLMKQGEELKLAN